MSEKIKPYYGCYVESEHGPQYMEYTELTGGKFVPCPPTIPKADSYANAVSMNWPNEVVGNAPDLAKMVDDMRLAKEALAQAKRAINGREHTGFIDKALTHLKPYEKLLEKEGESDDNRR